MIVREQSNNSFKLIIILIVAAAAVAVVYFNDKSKKKIEELNRENELANSVMKDATKWFFAHISNVTIMYDNILMHLCEDNGINEQNIGTVLGSFKQGKKVIDENNANKLNIAGKIYSYKNIPSDVTVAIGNNVYSTNEDIDYNMFIGGSDFYNMVVSNTGTQILPYIKKGGKAYFSIGAHLKNPKYKTCGAIFYEYEADNFKKFIPKDILDNFTAGDKERDLFFIKLDENNNPIILTGTNEKYITKNAYDVLDYIKGKKIYLFMPSRPLSIEKNNIKTDNGTYEVFSLKPLERDYYLLYSVKMGK